MGQVAPRRFSRPRWRRPRHQPAGLAQEPGSTDPGGRCPRSARPKPCRPGREDGADPAGVVRGSEASEERPLGASPLLASDSEPPHRVRRGAEDPRGSVAEPAGTTVTRLRPRGALLAPRPQTAPRTHPRPRGGPRPLPATRQRTGRPRRLHRLVLADAPLPGRLLSIRPTRQRPAVVADSRIAMTRTCLIRDGRVTG